MLLACRRPSRVSRLVVVDIAPRDYRWAAHRAEFAAMQELDLAGLKSRAEAEIRMEGRIPDWAMRKFITTNLERVPSGGWRWQVNLPALVASLPELERSPLGPGDHFDGPCLFLAGGRSPYIRPQDHAGIVAHFPAARIRGACRLRPQPAHRRKGGLREGPRLSVRPRSASTRSALRFLQRPRTRLCMSSGERPFAARSDSTVDPWSTNLSGHPIRSTAAVQCASWRTSRTELPNPPASTWSSIVTMSGTTADWLRRRFRSRGRTKRAFTTPTERCSSASRRSAIRSASRIMGPRAQIMMLEPSLRTSAWPTSRQLGLVLDGHVPGPGPLG